MRAWRAHNVNTANKEMATKKYVYARPDRTNWSAAVKRASQLLRENPKDSLCNTCQNVPQRFLPRLRSEALLLLQKD